MTQAADSNHYFELHGLTARPPEELNRALQTAIEQLERTLYAPSAEELTADELAVLRRAGVDVEEHSELPDPRLGYATRFAAVLATSLTPTDLAERLGVSPVRVRQMIHSGSLYAIRLEGRWHVPAFQITPEGLVPHIASINQALSDSLDAVSVVRWFTEPEAELELPDGTAVSPLEWLKRGHDPATLIAIAANL